MQTQAHTNDKNFTAAVQKLADSEKTVMSEAIVKAVSTAEAKQKVKPLPFVQQGELPMVITRTDILGKSYLFFPQSEDKAADTVVYWDGNKDGALLTAPTAYYHNMKRADDAASRKMAQQFSNVFGYKEFVARTRLIKEGSMKRDEEGKVGAKEIEAWKQKLIEAVTKVILEA